MEREDIEICQISCFEADFWCNPQGPVQFCILSYPPPLFSVRQTNIKGVRVWQNVELDLWCNLRNRPGSLVYPPALQSNLQLALTYFIQAYHLKEKLIKNLLSRKQLSSANRRA